MTDHLPSSSSPSSHIQQAPDSLSEIPQNLKVAPEEKAGMVPGSAVANAIALSLRVLKVNVLGCKVPRVYKSTKPKACKAIQTDPNHRSSHLQTKCVFHAA